MSKWIDFSIDERKAMVQGVVDTMPISESAVEKKLVDNGCIICGF